MKKSVSKLIPLLILCSFLVTIPKINVVKASKTIYIRSDGSVEGTDKIQRDGDVYTFTADIFDSYCIVVERDNIVVDGAGYTLQGTGAYRPKGIDLAGRSNVTIKNTRVSNTYYGIHLDESSNNNIIGNYITKNSNIALYSSSNNNVNGNNITNNNSGTYLEGSSNNTISRNNVANNYNGIWVGGSSNNMIYHNNFINNHYHLFDIKMNLWYAHASVNIWDAGYPSGGNYWGDYEARYPNATELDGSGLWDTPYAPYGNNQDDYPLMGPLVAPPPLDITPPTISIVSPENKSYTVKDVPLTSTLSESTSWIRYSLDGQANVRIAGNTTITGLSDGPHSLVIYATDTAGNTGASQTTYFSKVTPPPDLNGEIFLITNWIFWGMIIAAIVGTAILVYFRKIRKTTGKTEIISEGVK